MGHLLRLLFLFGGLVGSNSGSARVNNERLALTAVLQTMGFQVLYRAPLSFANLRGSYDPQTREISIYGQEADSPEILATLRHEALHAAQHCRAGLANHQLATLRGDFGWGLPGSFLGGKLADTKIVEEQASWAETRSGQSIKYVERYCRPVRS